MVCPALLDVRKLETRVLDVGQDDVECFLGAEICIYEHAPVLLGRAASALESAWYIMVHHNILLQGNGVPVERAAR